MNFVQASLLEFEMRKIPNLEWYETLLPQLACTLEAPELKSLGQNRQNYRFTKQSPEQAIYLLLVKYLECLRSAKLLLDNGQLISLGILTRVMDEAGDDLMFIAQTFDNKSLSSNHERFLKSFWLEPSSQLSAQKIKKPDQVPRNKVFSEIHRPEGQNAPDHIGLEASKDLHALTSTFVHSVAAPIMDIYNPRVEEFETKGSSQEWLLKDHRHNLENYFFRGVLNLELAAFALKNGFVAQIGPSKDSLSESSMLAEAYEQLDTYDVQDPELGRV